MRYGQCGIYRIRHVLNGKVYIGSAVDIDKRWRVHRTQLAGGYHHSRYLQRAWDKDGESAFVFEILDIVERIQDLICIEQWWIDEIRPFDREIGYNMNSTAGSMLGFRFSDESKVKLSESHKGKKQTSESIAKKSAALLGRKRSPEVVAAMIGRGKGRKLTQEHCAKISAAKQNISAETRAKIGDSSRGRKASPETRAKISAAMTGKKFPNRRPFTPEARARMSAAKRGITKSLETRARMSAAKMGHPVSEEARAKMSFSHKNRTNKGVNT